MDTTDRQLTETRIVRRPPRESDRVIHADVCVVGAGISGVSAAVEARRLGRSVVLVDALPRMGGQAVNGMIGTFAGLLSNGRRPFQLTYGIASDILRDLGREGALHLRRKHNTIMYEYSALSRWIEATVDDLGITVVLGGVLRSAEVAERRVREVELVTRYGAVRVEADGFVDASGDAIVAWNAGLLCREPAVGQVYGSQKVVLENVAEDEYPGPEALRAALRTTGERYGIRRKDGLANLFAGQGTVTLNAGHIETPLDPVLMSESAREGRLEAKRMIAFLMGEFPKTFAAARVRAAGLLGVRQTRWIVGTAQLSAEAVLDARRPDDAIARTGWGVELHNDIEKSIWEPLPEGHVHWIPFGALVPPEADNLVAVGRCIDGDVAALSSVRVMGPCIATGAAAAHALDLAATSSLHDVKIAELQERVSDNLSREDAYVG